MPDPEPAELLGAQLVDDRAQPVVAAGAAALAEAELAERQREVVDDDEHLGQRRALAGEHLAHGDARSRSCTSAASRGAGRAPSRRARDRLRGVPLAPAAGPPEPVRDPVEHHPADVVAGLGVLPARVPEPDDDLHVCEGPERAAARHPRPAGTANGPGTRSDGARSPWYPLGGPSPPDGWSADLHPDQAHVLDRHAVRTSASSAMRLGARAIAASRPASSPAAHVSGDLARHVGPPGRSADLPRTATAGLSDTIAQRPARSLAVARRPSTRLYRA